MKLNKLFVSALAVLTLVSCNKDEDTTQQKSKRGEMTRARIVLSQSTPETYVHYGNETPTEGEGEIRRATIYVFDNVGILEKKEEVVFDSGETEHTFEITTGQKSFYAAVNIKPTILPPCTENSSTMSQVQQGILDNISVASATDSTAAGDGFWMTSLAPVSRELDEVEEENADQNKVTIPVGRAVAKIGVYYDHATAVQQGGGVLKDVSYKVCNNPGKMYLVPIYNERTGLLQIPSGSTYNDNSTDFLATGLNNDQNYANPSYMIENSNNGVTAEGVTYLMLKGTFVPSTVYDENGENPEDATAGDDFYRIKKSTGGYGDKFYKEKPSSAEVTAVGGSEGKFVKYTDAECFYSMKLKDGDSYMVKRNTYFGVTITSVSGPGESDEPSAKPDPNEELEADTWMTAEISVLRWTKVNMDGGI